MRQAPLALGLWVLPLVHVCRATAAASVGGGGGDHEPQLVGKRCSGAECYIVSIVDAAAVAFVDLCCCRCCCLAPTRLGACLVPTPARRRIRQSSVELLGDLLFKVRCYRI